MTAHLTAEDYFQESIRGSFVKSIVLHGLVLVGVVGYVLYKPVREQMGDPNAGGSVVAVTAVQSIPLPSRGQPNPVANENKSVAPQAPPAPPKPAPKAEPKQQPEKAIPLKTERVRKSQEEVDSERQKFRPLDEVAPNVLTQRQAPALSDPLFAQSGSGRIGTGMNTSLGSRFADYSAQIRERVSRAWRTGDVDPRYKTAPIVIVTFEILRNGAVRDVRLLQRSGITTLDNSVQRAVLDAAPFPRLPVEFERDSATVEFQFELKR